MPRFRNVLRRSAAAAGTVFVAAALSNSPAVGQGTGTGLGASHAVFDPLRPDTVYVTSTLYGVFKSADKGATWRLLNRGMGASDFYALAVSPQAPEVVLIGAAGGGIYRSTDGGEHFVDASQGLFDTSVYDLVFDPRDARVVYALTLRQVFRSADAGLTWSPLFRAEASIADPSFHRRLAVLPTTPAVFLIAAENAAFRRAEGDGRWAPLGSGLAGVKVTTFAYDQATKTLYAAGVFAEGVYRSADAGATWSLVGGGLKQAWVQRLALDPRTPGVMYAATKNRGVLKSEDGGVTWREINEGLGERDIKALAIHPQDTARLVAATYGRGIFASGVSGLSTTVSYATADGTATAGSDYTAASGTATIPAGSTTTTITVSVIGDTTNEPDETFTVTLSSPVNATIATATGTGTILNDDAIAAGLRLGNISTRGPVQTGDGVMIGGFRIDGTGAKRVLIRARGLSLGGAPFNLRGVLANPWLQLYSGATVIAQNDNWQTTDPLCLAPATECGDATQISATGRDPCQPNPGQTVPPDCSNEAALLVTLPPGAYTAIVRGVNNTTGLGNVGVFEIP